MDVLGRAITRRAVVVAGAAAGACAALSAFGARGAGASLLELLLVPVELEVEGYELSTDGASLRLEVSAANSGEKSYASLTAEMKVLDADGFVVGSEELVLEGWLPACGTCSYEVDVVLPEGADAVDLGRVVAAREAELAEFGGTGVSAAVLSWEAVEGGLRLDLLVMNAEESEDYGYNQPAFSSVVASFKALDADGFVLGEAELELVADSDGTLTPGSQSRVSVVLPVEGATEAAPGGMVSCTAADMRDEARDYGLDVVEFGSYPRARGAEPEPIEWLVLDRKGTRSLLLSKYALDCRPYNGEWDDVTWEGCTLRAWLNSDFLVAAFTDDELARVSEVRLENPDNPDYGTPGGADTYDRAFLLSIDEVCSYFGAQTWEQSETAYEQLIAYPTYLAVANGAYMNMGKGGCRWWLRSPGVNADTAANVYPGGVLNSHGVHVGDDYFCVRPAMWVSDL